ncbi:MAG: aminotransferase class I/II-fold pyridoxal phosphate-dependent enzyme [Candidatus Aenigmarchaeota archaeon]|nr:aminotransferase class I/II-fold pyridoxal phosphate-dependent enzyme [Candidatus Aenigmarchaeota archaeon]
MRQPIKSPIRDLMKLAKEVAKEKKIYNFNIGDPNKFDFDTPDHLKQALIDVAKTKSAHYSDSEGEMELIEAILAREVNKNKARIQREDILITQGISEALFFLFAASITSKKDEVLLPEPTYPPYINIVSFFGGKIKTYRLIEENGWEPDVEDLKKQVTKNTKFIVVINPNNPTGAVYKEKILKEIVDISAKENIPIISDEIYDEIVFGDIKHVGMASIAKDSPLITLNGFSKSYLVPGWRIGYIYFQNFKDENFKEVIFSLARARLSASTPLMKACSKAYLNQNHIKEMNKKLKERAEYAYKRFNEIIGITSTKPIGAFYIFPKVEIGKTWKSDEEFCIDLLKNTGIIFPYGSGFGKKYGKNHFRSIILPPIEMMEEALQKLEDFMRKKLT